MASGTVRVTRLANPAGTAPGWPAREPAGREPAGAGVLAQEQVQVGAGADLVRPAAPARRPAVRRAQPGDPVIDRQHLVRRAAPGPPARRSRSPRPTAPPARTSPRSPAASAPCPGRPPSPRGRSRRAGCRGSAGPARSSTSASAARASAGSSRPVAAAISRALPRLTVPSRSAARVPGRWVSRCPAVPSSSSARNRDSPSAFAIWSAVNSASSGPGLRRSSSAMTASLRAAAWASTRSHAHTTPTSSPSETPANRSSSAAASAATASCAQPGSRSKIIPGPNAAAGLADSPGNTRAEPGWPGPRRPEVAAPTASSSSAAASRISASSSSVKGSTSPYRPPPRGSPRPARRAGLGMPGVPRPSLGRGPARRDRRPTRGPRRPVTRA